jgi:lysozyme
MQPGKIVRIAAAGLSLTAFGWASITAYEGYVEEAMIPIPGDRPTIGFGSTFWGDGSPVKLGERTTPSKAIRTSLAHIAKDEAGLKRCVTGDLSMPEWDILVDFTYWRGRGGACRSDVVKNINAGKYVEACEAYLNLDSRKAGGKDCKDSANRCRGVWLRAQERYNKCMAVVRQIDTPQIAGEAQ